MTKKPEPLLWLDSARGVFIPRDFATSMAGMRDSVANVTTLDWTTLEAGPELGGDSSNYWETWTEVEAHAIVTYEGVEYRVYQDTDCWLIPVGMEWDDEADWFVWP